MNFLLTSTANFSDPLLSALWRASWQGAVAIVAVWLLTRFSNLVSARVSCWVWRLVCVKILMTLVWIQPIELPVLPAVALVAPVVPEYAPIQTPRELPSVDVPPPSLPQTANLQADAPEHNSDPRGLITLAWICGVGVCITRTAREWLAARKLRASSHLPNSEKLANWCRDEADRLNIRYLSQVCLANVEGPLLLGCLRPAIVLPERAEELFDEAELRLMLRHELAHLKRSDLLWNWLPTVVGWMLFFNPLVWLLKRGWFESQEAACDELLIQSKAARAAEYGRLLLKLSTLWSTPPRTNVAAAGVLGAYRNLERRILLMTRVKTVSQRRLITSVGLILPVALMGITPWRLVAKDPEQTEKSKTADATAGYELSRIVKFELGRVNSREGDSITIDEVRGTADTMTAGNIYQVKGTYKLSSAEKASLAAFTTDNGKDPLSTQFQHVPTQKTQTVIVEKGEGRFTLLLYMWHNGWPHVSFYPANGGEGMGGVYFGTGESVYRPAAKSGDKKEQNKQAEAKGDKPAKQVKDYPITVSGKAIDGDGKPVPGAKIYLVSTNVSPSKLLRQTTTDGEGRYEFRDAQLPIVSYPDRKNYITQGCFQVFGRSTGHAFAWQPMKSVQLEEPQIRISNSYLLGAPIELNLTFLAPQRISGQMLNETETPIPDFSLELSNCNWVKGTDMDQEQDNATEFWAIGQARAFMPDLFKATTDANGRFEFRSVPPDTICWIRTQHPDFGNMAFYATTAKRAPARFNGNVIERQPVKMNLRRSKAVPLQLIFADSGKPAANVRVAASKQQSSGSSAWGDTDMDGYLTLRLPPGEYRICCDPKGTDYIRTYGNIFVKKDAPMELTRLQIERGCVVTLKVTDADTGAGIPDVAFMCEMPGQRGSRWSVQSNTWYIDNPLTNEKGELRAVVKPGSQRFSVGKPPYGYRLVNQADTALGRMVELPPGESVTAEFKMQRSDSGKE